jgi:hypothetical protein
MGNARLGDRGGRGDIFRRVIDIDLTGMGSNLDTRTFDPAATVPGFNITIREMRRALHDRYARAGGPGRRAGFLADPLRPWRGVRYWAFALIAGAIGLYFGWLTRAVDIDGTPGWLVYGGLGVAAAFYLGLRGAVCFRPRASTVLALDGRPPVIYLRSFHDDDAMVARPVRFDVHAFHWRRMLTEYTRGGIVRVMFQHGKVRLEQAIEDEVSAIGPFIAIGEPHESHPDFGATRAYFEGDDEAWRAAVRSWIERAALVIVVPGQTSGLAWELAQIQASGGTSKLLLVFPPERPTSRAARLAALAGMLTDPRWREAMITATTADLLATFPVGQDHLVRVYAQKPTLAHLEFAVELAIYGMFCLPTAPASPDHRPAPPRPSSGSR